MKPEVKKDLNEAGMTSVTRNGKRAKNMEGKVMKGFRGGLFGPMTVTCAYIKRNNDVRDSITKVMNDHGYHVSDSNSSMITYAKGNGRVKFLLIEIGDSRGYVDFWWILN